MTCDAKERAEEMISKGMTKEKFKADLEKRLARARLQVEHCERMLKLIAEMEST